MDNKPVHYDGSLQNTNEAVTIVVSEPFALTDEVRVKISGNPYLHEVNE
jgi:hypothetical protein